VLIYRWERRRRGGRPGHGEAERGEHYVQVEMIEDENDIVGIRGFSDAYTTKFSAITRIQVYTTKMAWII
jgi:hypothetical protein